MNRPGDDAQSSLRRVRLARLLLGASLGVLALLVVGSFIIRKGRPPLPINQHEDWPVADRFSASGMQHTVYDRGEKLYSLKADAIVHRKRKIGPLTINPVKELALQGVEIEIYEPIDRTDEGFSGASPVPIQELLRKATSGNDLGFISRVTIAPLKLVYFREAEELFTLTAKSVKMGLDTSRVNFEGDFTIAAAAGDRLRAHAAEWLEDERRFSIAGPYLLESAEGAQTGAGALFTIDPAGRIRKID